MNNEFEIDPLAKLDYGFDWRSRGWLDTTETITLSNWTVTGGLTLSSPTIVSDAITATLVEGAVLGENYTLSNTITTSEGRKDTRSIKLFCKNR